MRHRFRETTISSNARNTPQPARMILRVLAVTLLVAALPAAAADRYKVDDEVLVNVLGEWQPGLVVATNKRGEVLVDYEFAGGVQRKVFGKNEIRFRYEANALIPARTWTDSTGQFKTVGALLSINETSIRIRKEDMEEMEVPVDKLSAEDQRFLKQLEKQLGVFATQPPTHLPIERFDPTPGVAASSFGGENKVIEPDPVPEYLKLKQGGASFPTSDLSNRLGAVLPIGGPDGWILAAVESSRSRTDFPTRLLWASMARQTIDGQQLLPAGEIVLDYHPPSHRLLSYTEVEAEGSPWGKAVMSLWEVLPTDRGVKAVIRWDAAGDDRTRDPWARLLDGNLVIHRRSDHEIVIWDTAEKRIRYSTNQESFFTPPVTLSGNRRYLLIPEDKQVRILEAATGELLRSFPVTDGASGVAASEDGRRLAVLGRNSLTIWDLTNTSTPPQIYPAESIGTPFSATLHWIGNERIMVDTNGRQKVMFSITHQFPLWNYNFEHDAVLESGGRRLHDIVDNHLVFAARVSSGSQQGLAVGAVTLPGPKVEEAAATFNREAMLIVKPGTPVRIVVQAGQYTQQVQAALEKQVQDNGWVLSPSATTVLFAEMKRGETQQTTYRMSRFGFGGGGAGEQTVTVTPFIATLRLDVAGTIAWNSGTSTGAPPFLHLEEGQSVQAEVDKWQRPQPEFFENVDIPDRILDPAVRLGLGATKVSNKGLTVE